MGMGLSHKANSSFKTNSLMKTLFVALLLNISIFSVNAQTDTAATEVFPRSSKLDSLLLSPTQLEIDGITYQLDCPFWLARGSSPDSSKLQWSCDVQIPPNTQARIIPLRAYVYVDKEVYLFHSKNEALYRTKDLSSVPKQIVVEYLDKQTGTHHFLRHAGPFEIMHME